MVPLTMVIVGEACIERGFVHPSILGCSSRDGGTSTMEKYMYNADGKMRVEKISFEL